MEITRHNCGIEHLTEILELYDRNLIELTNITLALACSWVYACSHCGNFLSPEG